MKVLRFKLSGEHAFFKIPEVNAFYYFTYGHIHKVALLGLLGAVLGYGGYNQQSRGKEEYPEFYDKLKKLKIGIKPNKSNELQQGYFKKSIQTFVNTVGYANTDGNLIVKEQWLENPSWMIYIQLQGEIEEIICDYLMNARAIYIPYLGKNDHYANISEVQVIEGQKASLDIPVILRSLYPKEAFTLHMDEDDFSLFKYEEGLPFGLTAETNQYIIEMFQFTNGQVTVREECDSKVPCSVLLCEEEHICFF
ncbi:MAG: type I-B CRISPR-associated protein Cas5 [Lachnospiraceae bacterium]|nr:type I-B CRISPR-associated protein Cas5 [Lachnospiraceae bacterium]